MFVSVGGRLAPAGAVSKTVKKSVHGTITSEGDISRTVEKSFQGTVTFKGSLSLKRRREFLEKRPLTMWLLIVLTFSSPFIGLVLSGWPGMIVGLIIALLAFVLGPYAVMKVVESDRY